MDVYLNGQMVEQSRAMVSVEDAGFQHAVGLFETMAARNGRIFRLQQHLERLQTSATQLGLSRGLDLALLASAVETTVAHNRLSMARVRLTVTPGVMSMLRAAPGPATEPTPTVLVIAQPPTQYDPAYFEKGIMALVAPPGANPFDSAAGHKTLAYWSRLRTLRQAASVGAGEALWLNITNHLASGSVSNVFIVKDGRLLTPFARGEEVAKALPAPVLPGVTRAAIIDLAAKRSIEVERRMISVQDLLDADEAFLTNSSWDVLPVTRIEKKTLADGKVGAMTSDLRADLLELIEQETQPV